MTWDGRVAGDIGGGVDPATLSRVAVEYVLQPADYAAAGVVNGADGWFYLSDVGAWTSDRITAVGTAVSTTGGEIKFASPGIYALNFTLDANGMETSDPDMTLRLNCQWEDHIGFASFKTDIGCGLRGGDSSQGVGARASASRSFFHVGDDGSDVCGFTLEWTNFDTANAGTIVVGVSAQQIVPGVA